MKPTIGYLRVSTSEQGRSGLGLAAQRFDIERFCEREGFEVAAWHQDIQTGAGRDALLVRPGLAAALKEARGLRCALIVSRLDRLSRNVHFDRRIDGTQGAFPGGALWERTSITSPSISTPPSQCKSAR